MNKLTPRYKIHLHYNEKIGTNFNIKNLHKKHLNLSDFLISNNIIGKAEVFL